MLLWIRNVNNSASPTDAPAAESIPKQIFLDREGIIHQRQ